MEKIRLSYRDMLENLHRQSKDEQRFPYPIATIIEKAGMPWENVKEIPPSAIKASKRYQLFAIRFDKREMQRLGRTWMPGGWLLNKGPGQDTNLDGLEFLVDTTLIKKEK